MTMRDGFLNLCDHLDTETSTKHHKNDVIFLISDNIYQLRERRKTRRRGFQSINICFNHSKVNVQSITSRVPISCITAR